MAQQITYAQRYSLQACSPAAVLLYNHIPKCGGLSLTHMLRTCFPSSCDVHQNIFDPRAVPMDKAFYHGHGVSGIESFLPAESVYFTITMLRHPWKLAQSLVRFFAWLLPLDTYYQQEPERLLLLQEPNMLIHYLGHGNAEKAEENLFEKYLFFGLQEFFPASLTLLSQHIPSLALTPPISKNVSTKEKWHISAAVKDAFFEKNAQDIALFEKAQQEFFRRVQRYEEKTQQSLGGEPLQSKKVTAKDSLLQTLPCQEVEVAQERVLPQATDATGEGGEKQAVNVTAKGATPTLEASNVHGVNVLTVLNLKESIACNEDLPGMDAPQARFENWLFILVHSMQNSAEYAQYFHWLMQRSSRRTSCLYFAFLCALRGKLPQLSVVGRHLFTLCQARDPHNSCRVFIQCRLDILHAWQEHGLYTENDIFSQKLRKWAQDWKKMYKAET